MIRRVVSKNQNRAPSIDARKMVNGSYCTAAPGAERVLDCCYKLPVPLEKHPNIAINHDIRFYFSSTINRGKKQ